MCGRFTLRATAEEIISHFKLTQSFCMTPRYNIAPTQKIPVICKPGSIQFLDWGLKPRWMDKAIVGKGFFNARLETVAEKPAFREAFRKRRCLILSDGFYEWKTINRTKQPFFITPKSGGLFAFAGLWEEDTAVILTGTANNTFSSIHDRMPMIVDENNYLDWLKPNYSLDKIKDLLVPQNHLSWEIILVSSKVNSVNFDTPACIQSLQ